MARKAGLTLAIKSADFLPRRLTAQPDTVRELLLGRLVGEARGTFFVPDQNDPTKPPSEGIMGVFRFTDGQDDSRVIEAPKLWVPDNIAVPVKDALRDPETGEVRATAVELAFDVYAIRSSAPLGYTWKMVPVFEPTEADDHNPLNRITKRAEQLALPAPAAKVEDEPEAEKEPASPQAKHKGK